MLWWVGNFTNDTTTDDYEAYLSKPLMDSMYPRSKHESEFFWGISAFPPTLNLSGPGNLALLADQQIQMIGTRYHTVMNLTDILKTDNHATFHDFRKATRGFLT